MTTHKAPSAADRVFAIPELYDLILHNQAIRQSTLVRFRRINRAVFCNIMSSPALRRLLYLEPLEGWPTGTFIGPPVINPLRPRWIALPEEAWKPQKYQTDFFTAKRAPGTGALVEEMLFTQPPCTCTKLVVASGYWLQESEESVVVGRRKRDVTMGDIMEAAQALAVAQPGPAHKTQAAKEESNVVRLYIKR